MKCVVTGAAGFLGGALTAHLRRAGRQVVAIDHHAVPAGVRVGALGAGGGNSDGSSHCTGGTDDDILRLDASAAGVLDRWLDGDTTLFHFAASADVASSVACPEEDFANNLQGFVRVLEAARRRGCRVIFPSTASIYDAAAGTPFTEQSPVRPSSPYSAGKLAAEAYASAYHRAYGVDVRIARMCSVYGVGMRRFAIHDLIRKLAAGDEPLELLGDGRQIRDYLYVDDAVRGLLLIAESGEPGGDYNLASGVPVVLLDLARQLARAMGRPEVEIRPTGRSFAGDVPCLWADISRLRGLGFEPTVPLAEGLRRTIDWLCPRRSDTAGGGEP